MHDTQSTSSENKIGPYTRRSFMKNVILLFLAISTYSAFAQASKYTQELQCLKSAQQLINTTNELGFFDSISNTYTFNDDKNFYIVAENKIKVCDYDNTLSEVSYKIPVNDQRSIFYHVTQVLNLYSNETSGPTINPKKCRDLTNKDIQEKVSVAIKKILEILAAQPKNHSKTSQTQSATTLDLKNCQNLIDQKVTQSKSKNGSPIHKKKHVNKHN